MRFSLCAAAAAMLLTACHVFPPGQLDRSGWRDCRFFGGDAWTRVISDPENCGACNIRCPEGVPCSDYECRIDSVLHCGDGDRQCVAREGEVVACVQYFEGDAAVRDEPLPEGVELVNGYACVSASGESDADADAEGRPKRLDPGWVLIPGHTADCRDDLDARTCVTAEVTYTDLCGATVTEPLAYDFAIMTAEVSRAQYRDAVCDCADPQFATCRALCDEQRAPDAAALEQRPMTGLNWCEAYTACQRLGGRLPTVAERARLEALVDGPPSLFADPLSCGAWAEATGRPPWLAECIDAPPDGGPYDAVKGEAGRLYIGADVWTDPEPVQHLLGNVDEWAADPAAAMAGRGSSPDPAFWGVPEDAEAAAAPRVLRGRGFFSPAGEPGDRLVAADPSLRAADVGLRCARTMASPFDEPVPYDATLQFESYATCDEEPIALRPLRRTVGEQGYRAIDVCLDHDLSGAAADLIERRARQLLLDPAGASGFALRTSVGVLEAVGVARFAGDEQWWWSEPAERAGQRLACDLTGAPVWLTWNGEGRAEASRCRALADASTVDGRVVRRHDFTLDRAESWVLDPGGLAFACAHLDCVDPSVGPAECPTDCPGWHLPLAIEFERVEPYSTELCR